MSKLVYISITGLELKAFWHYPTFTYYAVRSFSEAQAAPGNISTAATKIGTVHHTLTVWDSKSDMIRFFRQGAHADSMKVFDRIATGKVYGYEAECQEIPTWDEARIIWENKGRIVGSAGREAKKAILKGNEL